MDVTQSDWRDLFLASAGRTPRAPFLLATAVLIAVAALYETLAGRVAHWITGWIFYPVLVFCAASVLAKRLHDRGRSGWWAGLVLLGVLVVWPHPAGPVSLLFTVVLAWAAIDLGAMPGEPGPNRYGPSPLGPPAAA